ncbi:type VI secretion system accessory protein TagJ [Variovorax sp. CY25R-8]|uniref:type VI secretion system accessory protein TagJ n=1 Tax=Variovorax sp. CY25R-8 TaxID=2855501 RepID=UPI0021BAA4DA|nr:type VI secretion system accessory protein TagJ [Variovorax sp. CY25R-8]MCT8177280.1 virulence protein SciE type [Variovorax sp. CY25R-8]
MGDAFAGLGERSVAEHTEGIQRQIRADPQNASLRLALCHFLALRGEWQRAEDQLKAAVKFDPSFTPASATCSMALAGERQRSAFWAGDAARAPAVLGEGADWVDALIAAAALPADRADEATRLRESARDATPALRGLLQAVDRSGDATSEVVDGEALERIDIDWLCDGDARLGAALEVITPAGYGWLPLPSVRRLKFQRPQHLVDLLWSPVQVELADGRALAVLVPVRYAGELATLEDGLALARRTDWLPLPGEAAFAGAGQRTLISDAGDHALLELRTIEFAAGEAA